MHPFYSVVSDNGVAVTNEYYRAKDQLNHLKGLRWMKGFSNFMEASDYALNHLFNIAPCKVLPYDLPLNSVVYVSSLKIRPFIFVNR